MSSEDIFRLQKEQQLGQEMISIIGKVNGSVDCM